MHLQVLLHGPPASRNHRLATLNFCRSVAAWAVACYVLQIKDRHNGNIMVHATGCAHRSHATCTPRHSHATLTPHARTHARHNTHDTSYHG